MKKTGFEIYFVLGLLLVSSVARADLFVGQFEARSGGELYRMIIEKPTASGYEGVISVNGEPAMQVDARRFGDRIAGRLNSADGSQGFVAEIGAGTPVLHLEDGRTIIFRRVIAQ